MEIIPTLSSLHLPTYYSQDHQVTYQNDKFATNLRFAVQTLKNSYQRFEEEGILYTVKSKDAKAAPRLRLASEWAAPRDPDTGILLASGKLWDFTEKIASSRREGKNRRDGATVSTRVLRLTDKLGAGLFEEAEAAGAASSVAGGGSVKKRAKAENRRRKLEGRAHL